MQLICLINRVQLGLFPLNANVVGTPNLPRERFCFYLVLQKYRTSNLSLRMNCRRCKFIGYKFLTSYNFAFWSYHYTAAL